MNQLSKVLNESEKVFWEGGPVFRVYTAGHMVVVGLLVLLLAGFVTVDLMVVPGLDPDWAFSYLFLICGIVGMAAYAIFDWRARHYAITDKRIIFQNGIIGRDFQIVDFDQITNAEVNVDLLDKLFGRGATGTISIAVKGVAADYIYRYRFQNITNPYDVFKFLKQVSHDVKTDIQYPNQLRPAENPGYKTNYEGPKEL